MVPTRGGWLLIACAMAMSAVVYIVVIQTLLASGPPPVAPDAPVPRALFRGAAAGFVVASMLWTQLRLRSPIRQAASSVPPGQLFGPAEFQLRSVVSLALAEVACVLGFVQALMFRAPLRDYFPFGAATVLVVVLDIIPVGLRYWSSREA
jgi:hypothetical protein